MSPFRDRYECSTIELSQGQSDLTVRVQHPRLGFRGRVETEEVNWASLEIEYRPARLLMEWVVLTGYLEGLTSRAAPLEQLASEIAVFVKDHIAPASVRVTLRTVGDHGYSFEVTAT